MTKPRKLMNNRATFESLLRVFMAGKMSARQGNAAIRALEKKAFMHGFSRRVRAEDITKNNLVGSKYAWYCYQRSRP